MRTPAKIGMVAAGYAGAILIASVAVAIRFASEPEPDRQGGMYAFGDSLLFLAVYGVASIPATCAALFFLRPRRAFWQALSGMAVVIAAIGLAALIAYLAQPHAAQGSLLYYWSESSVLMLLVAPLFALLFLLASIFAPSRSFRLALSAATLIEAAAFVGAALVLFHSRR